MVAVGRAERQLRRGPTMAAVEELAITPLPSLNRLGRKVEVVEEITATLAARWPVRFCSDECARRR